MDYQKSLVYFYGKKSHVLIVLGVICICVGILISYYDSNSYYNSNSFLNDVGFLAITLFVIGGVFFYGYVKWTDFTIVWPVSDADYDAEVLGFARELKKSRALNKLGLDESEVKEVAPIVLYGYDFEGADKIKKGDDGKWRSNIFKLVALFSSANELHGYTMRFNTLRDVKTEGTDVFFYQDIVSVSTSSIAINAKVDGKDITVNPEAFRLTTKGGTSITVCLEDSNKYQKSVNAMRALLREKKQA